MSDDAIGLTFQETMAGGFALGASDPYVGRREGERAGTELAMHAVVSIPDLDRFLAEPTHAGALSGAVDFPPWGMAIPAESGIFNLFRPSGQARLKLMIYELAFTHDARPYYLAGRKEVRNDPGADLWRDTTTLITRLHSGRDATGAVVGAGILSLGVGDLIRLLGALKVENAMTVAQRAQALRKFGQFFLGELWDSYAPHVERSG